MALLLMTFVLPKLLFAGGSGDGGDPLTAPPIVAGGAAPATALLPGAPAAPGAPAVPGPPADPPPENNDGFTHKYPFTPQVDLTPDAPGVVTDVSGPVTGGTDDGDLPSTSTPSDPTDTADGTDDPGTTASGPRPVQRVSLIDVSSGDDGARASIQVNDNLYEVAEGEEFAGSYRVVSLSDSEGCAQLLYGDDRFRVCEGEELLK